MQLFTATMWTPQSWLRFAAVVSRERGYLSSSRTQGQGFDPNAIPNGPSPENLNIVDGLGIRVCRELVAAEKEYHSAEHVAQGYAKSRDGAPTPYRGYYYHILTRQGKNALRGAKSFIVNGKMAGDSLLWPIPRNTGHPA
jgi:hypothetical protein